MKPTITQQMYAYIMTNPGCSTASVATHVNADNQRVSSWLLRMEKRGQLRVIEVGAGRTPNKWAVTNRPVRFNLSAAESRKPSAKTAKDAEVINGIKELKARLEQLELFVTK